ALGGAVGVALVHPVDQFSRDLQCLRRYPSPAALLRHLSFAGPVCRTLPHIAKSRRMSVLARTVTLLVLSNIFMTFAWYAHLRNLGHRAWYVAALVSWGIALFEYLLQVPANRIGFTEMT